MPRFGVATPCRPSTGCGTGPDARVTAMLAAAVAAPPRGSVTRTPTV